ncbi:MAG: PIN domain-containing protein [Pseudomonadota bacterium]|nr:PIN domain-containing protein [Pseudomonadota bacterium]
MKATLLDTGVIVALLDQDEQNHLQCVEVISDIIGPLVTCEVAVAEACYLLRCTPGAPEAVIKNIANGVFQIPVRLVDRAAAVETLLKKYRDVPMDLADACLVDLADQMDSGQILTLDRDFELYRWRSRRKFELLVDL